MTPGHDDAEQVVTMREMRNTTLTMRSLGSATTSTGTIARDDVDSAAWHHRRSVSKPKPISSATCTQLAPWSRDIEQTQ
jgi:hypothetical protein